MAEELLRVVIRVREMRTRCSGCGGAVVMDSRACPQCGHRLNASCSKCGRALQSAWQFCPLCASSPAPKLTKKQLRERQRQLVLPPANVATFKNQNR
jgi:rRNA maturation endonuclease Nob1